MGLAKAIVWKTPVTVTYSAGPNASLLTLPNVVLWTADADTLIESVEEIHEVLGTDGSAVTLDIVKCSGTQAAASGTTLLASTFSLKAAINTRVSKNRANGGVLSTASAIVLAGQRIALKFSGTMTSVAGVSVTLTLRRRRRPAY